jgi:cell division septum initiation protein DivIVA
MTEPTTTTTATTTSVTLITNANRPPLFTMLKTVGLVKKGTRVTPIDEGQLVRGRLAYRVVAADATKRDELTGLPVPAEAMERTFRTGEERELGRDFTDEEATANEKQWTLRLMILAEERRRSEIAESIERMAQALERAASTIRNELASPSSDLALKVERVQHELAWLFPNLGAHSLTHAAVEWSTNQREVSRLLTEGIAPA